MKLMVGVMRCLLLGLVVWLPLLGLIFAFEIPCAHAVPLPTGDTALSGTTHAQRPELGGVVQKDELTPYSFQGAGFSVSGAIQNRVVRSDDGTLDFYWRIIPDASSTGQITAFRVGGFHGFSLDGDFRLDGVGSIGPDTAHNSGDGQVTFLFSDGVSATHESSFFFFLDTQATDFSNTGSYVLLCADNDCTSPQFATFAPTSMTNLPNLQPTEITFDPSTAIVGGSVFFDSGVRNTGDVDTGVFNIKWLVNGQEVGAVGSHAGVPAGQTILDGNSQFSWMIDSPGTYSVTFTVDFDNQIEESNEEDNSTTIDVVVGQSNGSEVAYFTPGTEVAVTSPQTIGPTGGIIQAPAGSPLEGVSVEFPAGALSSDSEISLAYNAGTVTTIVGTHSGINIVLHSSTVTVFEQPVSITIPFSSSQDIPVPYFIDDSGRLHLLQLVNIDAISNSATFQTFHASIFTWIKDHLDFGDSYTTAFQPEQDGFQIDNKGSHWNRGGECFGMSTFSLWYFANIKAKPNEGNFYPRFMEDPPICYDSDGRPRTGQHMIAMRAFNSIAKYFNTYFPRKIILSSERILSDELNYGIIKSAIRTTNNPVPLYLYNKTGMSPGTHSVLAYGYDSSGLQIYDVNIHGTTQAINFDASTKTFDPYIIYSDNGEDIVLDGIIYGGDGTFPLGLPFSVAEPYDDILDAAKHRFSSDDATITITSHRNGYTVSSPIVMLAGSIISGRVPVEKLKILVGSTEYQANVAADGTFSTTITVNNEKNYLLLTPQGRGLFGELKNLHSNMDCTDFLLTGDFQSSVMLVTLNWDTNDSDLDLYVIDPTGDYSSYYHKCTADGGCLDFDITTGYGPEHWTLTTANTIRYGEDYTVRVHYYSDNGHGPSNYTVSVQFGEGESAITTYYRGNLAVSNPSNNHPTDTGPDWVTIKTFRFVAPSSINTQSAISRGVHQEQPLIITVPVPPFEDRIKSD